MSRLRLFSSTAALLVALFSNAPAKAHSLSVAHLDAMALPKGQVSLDLDLAVRDLALDYPLDADGDEQVTWAEVGAAYPQMSADVLRRVTASRGGMRCRLDAAKPALRRYDDGAYVRFLLTGSCNGTAPLAVDYGMFFERDPQHRAIASITDGRGTHTYFATAANTRLGAGEVGVMTTAFGFFREGIAHILAGYDHLAFVFLLLLPAVLRRHEGRWVPAESFRAALWQAAAVVTAFTVAHSLTLVLAVLGWVRPASSLVEPLIAASVALAAANNVWPVVTRRLALAGFGFGLLHGFGFAGALAELGLPQGARLASLVGFNLGVEAGQLLVVLALLPVLYLVRNRLWYRRGGLQLLSGALGLLALFWLFERIG